MPFKSKSQQRWAHTAAGKKALGGDAAVKEWDQASKGKKLPEKVGKSEPMAKAAGAPGMQKIGESLSNPGTLLPSASAGAGMKNPMKVGQQATVKTPKTKKMADPFGKPSLFFKSEEFSNIKKPSVEKLRAFLEKNRSKRNLK